MKQKDMAQLIMVAGFAAIVSFVISKAVFSSGQKPTNVPIVNPLSTDFPDAKNDPNYRVIFYNGALDPTQLIQIGGSGNSTPFNGQ